MKKYLIIISVIAMLLCFTTAMAAPVDSYILEEATTTLLISGKQDGYKMGDQYKIIVFDKEKVYDAKAEYDDAKIAEDIIFMSQISASENGGYTIRVNMTGKESGYYMVRVNGEDAKNIFFATEKDKTKFLTQLRRSCSADKEASVEKVKTILDLDDESNDAVNLFMLTDEYVTSAPSGLIAGFLYDEIMRDPLCIKDSATFVATINKVSHVAALNEGTIQISELHSELELDSKYTSLYNEKLSDNAKKSVVEDSYKGKKYNVTEAKAAYNDAVALAYIKNFGTWADAKYFVENIASDYNVDASGYKALSSSVKNDLYDYMTGSVAKTSPDAFVKLVNSKIKDLKKDSDKGSSGGGGGGGGIAGTPGGYTTVTPDEGANSSETGFADMADYAWAKESVDALASKGIVSGVGDNKFEPSRNVKREEMLAMLLRAYDVNVEGAVTDKFTDVTGANWYAPYVAAGLDKGYVNGVSETEFGAGANVSRQDVAVMAYRIAISKGKTFPANSEAFADEMQIADYAKEAVNALKAAGVINGRGDGSFAPNDTCTRAEAAKIIYTLIK